MAGLAGLPLTSLDFSNIGSQLLRRSIVPLTDAALDALRNMPSKSLKLADARELTADGVMRFQGLPLADLELGSCSRLGGDALLALQVNLNAKDIEVCTVTTVPLLLSLWLSGFFK